MVFTLAQLRNADPPASLPRIRKSDFTHLLGADYYDGWCTGMLLYQGRECWFEVFQDNPALREGTWNDGDWERRLAVIVMTPEQIAKEREVEADFNRYIWDPDSKTMRPSEQQKIYYEKYADHFKGGQFENCEVIAWFEA